LCAHSIQKLEFVIHPNVIDDSSAPAATAIRMATVPRPLALFLLFGLLLVRCERERPEPPSVLLITLDTFRADRLGPRTPALARLAADGVRFDAADSPVPLTLPAHATLLSGMLPLHHGLRNNGVGSFPEDRDTLATLLSRKGYRTGAFVGSFILDHRFGLGRGFDRYDDEIPRDADEKGGTIEAERRGSEVVDRALAWLKETDSRPFFAWVHLYDAHAPYAPPAPYPQTYDGEVAYVDAQVARLLTAIDRKRTIVVVVADHGEALGEHGELTHGLLLYEPTLHVPLIVAAPGIKAQAVRSAVSTVDVAPTIAALAGVALARVDGSDLLKAAPSTQIYAETEYPATFGWSGLTSIRSGDAKLITGTYPELFDLRRDPSESRNRLADDRRTYHALASKLEAVRATAVSVRSTEVDEETRRKLASLGYVAPGASTGGATRDPRAMAPLFRKFEEATWAINDGRASEAIPILRQIVRDDPSNHVFRQSLARALRQTGDVRAAIALHREAVALAPHDADAWYNLAAALQETGQTLEAGVAIREAIRRDPGRPEAHNTLGIIFSAEGNDGAAEDEFKKAIGLDPHDPRPLNNLGNVLRKTGRLDDAHRAYVSALRLAPGYIDALNGLGVVEVQRDRPREAIPLFERAIQLAPAFYEAKLNRAIALQLAGDPSEAALQLRRLLAEMPQSRSFAQQRQAARTLLSRMSGR
jgi:choline-sulfatase